MWMVWLFKRLKVLNFNRVVIIDSLKWNDHVKYISAARIPRNVGIFFKLRPYVPSNILLTLYNTRILPFISYCNLIWENIKWNTDIIYLLKVLFSNAGYPEQLIISILYKLPFSCFAFKKTQLPVTFSILFQLEWRDIYISITPTLRNNLPIAICAIQILF